MGQQTLYHPVSLNVIRGAAEYAGFKLREIRQIASDQEFKRATYNARIVEMPLECFQVSEAEIEKRLQACFMDDVRVSWVHRTYTGRLCCVLNVNLTLSDEQGKVLTVQSSEELPWTI